MREHRVHAFLHCHPARSGLTVPVSNLGSIAGGIRVGNGTLLSSDGLMASDEDRANRDREGTSTRLTGGTGHADIVDANRPKGHDGQVSADARTRDLFGAHHKTGARP